MKKRLFAIMQTDPARVVSCSLCGETVKAARLAMFYWQSGGWWCVCPDCARKNGAIDLAELLEFAQEPRMERG